MADLHQWQERLRSQLNRAPSSVNSGSVQLVRDFKKFHQKASKELGKSRHTEASLARLQAEFNSWYSGGEA